MDERESISGAPVTDEQIAAWADEAEAGYDVAALKKRGRGRPGRGNEPSTVVTLRLTAEELAVLDARAEREGRTRSEVIRDALAAPTPEQQAEVERRVAELKANPELGMTIDEAIAAARALLP
jgi:hypothetical protein